MTEKTFEQELASVHYTRVNKALDGLIRHCEKHAVITSPEQQQAVLKRLNALTTGTVIRLQMAFGLDIDTKPAQALGALQSGVFVSGPQSPPQPNLAALRAPQTDMRIPLSVREVAEPRPIGRLAKNADEPDAGEVVIGLPIRATREVAPSGLEGVGFLNGEGKDAKIEA